MTTPPASLAAALAAFQAEMPTVHKGQTATVPTKAGGSYSYTYADLADVTAAAMPILTKHGLAFSACPRLTEHGGYELAGILLHKSGERLEGSLPIRGEAQALGSAITYMRRYLLGAMTGIVTDDDDDGRAAQQRPALPPRGAPSPQDPTEDPWDRGPGEPMKTNTRGRLFALFAQKGIAEGDQLTGANAILGMAYTSRSQFTEADARTLIEALKKRPDVETPLPEEPS